VGQNNSGKSAILKALNCFFNPKEELNNFILGTHLYSTKGTIPKIIITFTEVINEGNYQGFLINNELTIKLQFSKIKNKIDYFVIYNGNSTIIDEEFKNQIFSDIQFVLIPIERGINSTLINQESILKKPRIGTIRWPLNSKLNLMKSKLNVTRLNNNLKNSREV
jgi:predicted ATP-dependent endonuclease of OLD family